MVHQSQEMVQCEMSRLTNLSHGKEDHISNQILPPNGTVRLYVCKFTKFNSHGLTSISTATEARSMMMAYVPTESNPEIKQSPTFLRWLSICYGYSAKLKKNSHYRKTESPAQCKGFIGRVKLITGRLLFSVCVRSLLLQIVYSRKCYCVRKWNG